MLNCRRGFFNKKNMPTTTDKYNISPLIQDINTVLRATMQRIGLADSRLARSIELVYDEELNFKIKFKDYAHFIDSGRRAGATPPPIAPILDYIERKNISPTNISKERLAFAISRAIGKRGIKPRPFLDRLHEEVTELIKIHIFEEIQEIIKEIF